MISRCLHHLGLIGAVVLAAALVGLPRDARAADTTITALTNQSCAGTRAARNLGCTSNDFTTTATFTQPSASALTSCVAGQTLSLDIIANIQSNSATRYDGAIFMGQMGNDPSQNDSTKTCSLGVFPTTPAPFYNDVTDNDACGDFTAGSQSNLTVTGLLVKCQVAPGTNKLGLPYTLVFDNQSASGCTSSNVTAATNAKCISATSAQVTGVVVQGYITLTKATTPTGQTQAFSFAATGTSTPSPSSFTLTDAQTQMIQIPLDSAAGSVTLQLDETALSGWKSTSTITCTSPTGGSASSYVTIDGANRRITATLSPTNFGANCTITNEKLATVTFKEQTVGGTGAFSFGSGSNGMPSSLSLDTSTTNPQTSSTYIVTANNTATALTQTLPTGWVLTSATCSDGTTTFGSLSGTTLTLPAGNVTAGKNITCTYTNTKLATVTIKEQSNGGTGSFAFGSGTNGLPSSLSLDTSTTNPQSSSAYIVTANSTSTAITQTVPSGWVLTSANCTDGSTTFGTLAGSTLTIAAGNVSAGKVISCTFTNDKLATVTIKEQSNGGTGTFSFTSGTNGLPASLSLDTSTTNPQSSSAYTVTANSTSTAITQTVPSGWVLSSANCTDGSTTFGTLSGSTLTIASGNVTAGRVISCTFTNDKLATVTIKEQSNGGTGTFSFTSGTNGLPASLSLDTSTTNPKSSSAYIVTANSTSTAITQTVPSGWVLSSANCTDGSTTFGTLSGSTLTIASGNVTAGKAISCTFTNDKLATVTIKEQSNGGTGTFSFTSGTNGLPASLSLDTSTTNPQSSSVYTVTANGTSTAITQTGQSGWVLSSANCTDGSTTFGTLSGSTLTIASGNVTAGKVISCTFTNDKLATVTIKEQSNGGTGTFSFTSGTNGLPASLSLDTSTTNPQSSSVYTVTVNGNATAITQTVPSGWVLSSANCTDGSTTFGTLSGSTLTVASGNVTAGKVISCTFTNTQQTSTLTKSFSATTVAAGAPTTLTFTITNSTGNPAQSGLGFTDTLPTNLVVATPLTTTNTCGGSLFRGGTTTALAAGDSSIKLSGGALSSGTASCTVTVRVSSTTAATYTNGSGNITGLLGGLVNGVTDQTLTVYALPNLVFVKSADKATATPGEVVTYTLLVQNAGAGVAKNVVLSDPLSSWVTFSVNAFGAGGPFQFTDGSPVSGLTLSAPEYSIDGGTTWTLVPTSGGGGAAAGYDNRVTKWRIAMSGTMNAGTQFTLVFKVAVR